MKDKTLLLILVAFVAMALAWSALVPPFENLDEFEHFEVVCHIAATGRLPIHGVAEAIGYQVRQEASQPPLYHLLAAGWVHMWGLSAESPPHAYVPESVVACGITETFYNKATRIHNLYEGLSNASLRTLYSLRVFSTLLQALTVAGVWTLARRIFPHGPAPLLATALVAFNPQFLLVAADVSNDNVVTPLTTWGLVLAFDLWHEGPSLKRVLAFGALSGLAGLSKLSGLGLVGLGGWALLVRTAQRKLSLRELVAWSALIVVLAGAIIAPWLLRNYMLYGDPTALAPMLEIVGHREYAMDFNEVKLTLLSYWGQLPCSFYPRGVYWPYLLVMSAGVLAVVLSWRDFSLEQKASLSLAGMWFAVILAAWVRWNHMTPATGGRLLFPAIAAPALILAAGLARQIERFSRRGTQWLAAFVLLWSLLVLCVGPLQIFVLPAQRSVDAVPPNPVDVTFGEALALRGYEARVTETPLACWFASTAYCRPVLDVDLYWQATQPITADYTMALQLVSPVAGETNLRLNYNHWPGRGNLPTSVWPSGRLLHDRYRIPLPESATPTQAWNLSLAFVEESSGVRLPVYRDGNTVGDAAVLALLRVPGRTIPLPDEVNAATPASFGDSVLLQDAQVTDEGSVRHVLLLWESVAPLDEAYTIFVHAYDAGGTLLATGDGPPQSGHFTTDLWEPEDRIRDEHTLTLPPGSTPARIAVGLYHPASDTRLPASFAGAPLPDNAVIIWEAEP